MSISARSATLFLALSLPALAEDPLSAIDWLSDSITEPYAAAEPPVASAVESGTITTTKLDGPQPDAVGLLPSSVTGLPRQLWGPGDPVEIARLIRAETVDTLPSAQGLLRTILLAEADPPVGAVTGGELLEARVDKLLDLGLVEEASALLERSGAVSPELFRRAFDVSLLLGEEDGACAEMRERPDVAPTFPARIFCLARGGDWPAAALTLGTTRALGQITPDEEALLSRFLDPDLYEGEDPLQPPARPSPLVYRMHEAVGEPLPSNALPRAFAHADLRSTSGWKAQLDAAERLARTGALDPNRLFGLYTERRPAASGGVWERAEAVQALDRALESGDADAVSAAIGPAWDEMQAAGLLPALAAFFGQRLSDVELTGEASAKAFKLALLTDRYEEAAAARQSQSAEEDLLIAIARGLPLPRVQGPTRLALVGLSQGALPPAEVATLINRGRLGEALLVALKDLATGITGDPRKMSGALAVLRTVGLESAARRAALEYLILTESA